LDELQAAALRIKLGHLEEWNERRRQNAMCYRQALGSLDIALPYEAAERRHIYHLYVIRARERDALRGYLNEQGVGTGIHYPVPVHLQEPCAMFGGGPGSLPVTEEVVGQILSLPMYPELKEEQIYRVAEEIGRFLKVTILS
jgi:dTDP-4-amino-4,6-dideoxygalactose transaminase